MTPDDPEPDYAYDDPVDMDAVVDRKDPDGGATIVRLGTKSGAIILEAYHDTPGNPFLTECRLSHDEAKALREALNRRLEGGPDEVRDKLDLYYSLARYRETRIQTLRNLIGKAETHIRALPPDPDRDDLLALLAKERPIQRIL